MATMRQKWPDDGDDEGVPQSGPLGPANPMHITGALDRRLLDRYHADDADDIVDLTSREMRALDTRLSSHEPLAPRRTPTAPPIADAPTQVLYLPQHQPPQQPQRVGSLTQRLSHALQARTAVASAPRVEMLPVPRSWSLTRLVASSWHIGCVDGYLPAHILAMSERGTRTMWLSPLLFAEVDRERVVGVGDSESRLARLENVMMRTVTARYVMAALWVRRHLENEFTERYPMSGPAVSERLVATLAPAGDDACGSFAPQMWQPWHAGYYQALWRKTNQLVASRDELAAHMAAYLHAPMPPQDTPALRNAVTQHALRYVPTLMEECPDAQTLALKSWLHFLVHMGRELRVPVAVVRDRLAGDALRIQSARDLCTLTDGLLASNMPLSYHRGYLAQCNGLRASEARVGGIRTAAQHVALWLAEPYRG